MKGKIIRRLKRRKPYAFRRYHSLALIRLYLRLFDRSKSHIVIHISESAIEIFGWSGVFIQIKER